MNFVETKSTEKSQKFLRFLELKWRTEWTQQGLSPTKTESTPNIQNYLSPNQDVNLYQSSFNFGTIDPMNSFLYHLQINIDFRNIAFYKGLMEFMGWKVIFEKDDVVGYKSDTNGDLWFCKTDHNSFSDYDAKGVNHISIRVSDISNIDEAKEYLNKIGIEELFGTPRHRPEFADSQDETYYQIMFESPDKILFEVIYIGPKLGRQL